jgi:type IX secretion system PorP/SprF family membrane protein
LFLVFPATLSTIKAQDPVYSQFYNAPLQLNPGFAGISHAPRFTLLYRNQWPFVSDAFASYATYSASYDQYFDRLNSGVGLMIMSDDAGGGLIKTNRASLFYSYNLQINNDTYLKGGIEAGFIQTRIGWDLLVFGDQLDPRFGNTSPGGTPYPSGEVIPEDDGTVNFDVSFGLLVYSKRYYAGIALKHLNTPDLSVLAQNGDAFDGLPMRLSVHAGMEFPLQGSNAFITPNVLFVKQGDFTQLNAGAYVGINAVFAGLWYRHAGTNVDAVIASFGVKQKNYKIGYSFDYTVSSFGIDNGGSHEIGFIVDLVSLVKKKSVYNDCFQLFR